MAASEPLYDWPGFGRRVSAAVEAVGNMRAAAAAAGVSASTICRAARGSPDLSHENWLRLTMWMAELGELEPA